MADNRVFLGSWKKHSQSGSKKGYNAVVTARNIQTIIEFQEKYPEKALVVPLDVTDIHSVH